MVKPRPITRADAPTLPHSCERPRAERCSTEGEETGRGIVFQSLLRSVNPFSGIARAIRDTAIAVHKGGYLASFFPNPIRTYYT